jgi:hypothetical protein
MTRSELVNSIFEREYARLFRWAAQFVDTWTAGQVCYAGFSALMWSGVSGRHTSKGTVGGLYLAAEPTLRRALEVKGSYLPVGAWKRAVWPTYDEGQELAAVYSAWVYVNVAADFGFRERAALATALRSYRPGALLLPTGTAAADEDAMINSTLRRIAAQLDEIEPHVPRAAERAREVWHRERYRTAASYTGHGSLLGGTANGEDKQDRYPGYAGQTDTVDQLAGLWRLRNPQPVPGIRDDPEHASDERGDR